MEEKCLGERSGFNVQVIATSAHTRVSIRRNPPELKCIILTPSLRALPNGRATDGGRLICATLNAIPSPTLTAKVLSETIGHIIRPDDFSTGTSKGVRLCMKNYPKHYPFPACDSQPVIS